MMHVDDLEEPIRTSRLSVRARRACDKAGVDTPRNLSLARLVSLTRVPQIGVATIREILELMVDLNIRCYESRQTRGHFMWIIRAVLQGSGCGMSPRDNAKYAVETSKAVVDLLDGIDAELEAEPDAPRT